MPCEALLCRRRVATAMKKVRKAEATPDEMKMETHEAMSYIG
jgi:hypothetical protein